MTCDVFITAADLAPIPYIERCDYNEFIAKLAQLHGPDYLRRPDGTLLNGVVTIPQPSPKRAQRAPAKRQPATLPNTYTGNPLNDFQPQMRGIIPMVEYERPDGSVTLRKDNSVKAQVLAALEAGPKTLAEIVKATGLMHGQVKNTLHRYNGTLLEPATNRAMNNQWRLIAQQPQAKAERDPTLRERIEAYVQKYGPASAADLARALDEKRDTVYATCYAAATITVVGKTNGKTVLWGLANAQTQMANAA